MRKIVAKITQPLILKLTFISSHFSWLLHKHPMFVRSSYEYYTDRVEKYFKALLAKVSHLQFYTDNGAKGGPIIMAQVSKIDFVIEC